MSTQVAYYLGVKLEPYIPAPKANTKAVQFAPSQTIARGTVVGQITAAGATQGMFKPYATGNSDGSQVPIGLTVYDIVVDANSNVVLGLSGASFGVLTPQQTTSEIYYTGVFLESELTGLDAGAVTAMKAREQGYGTTKHIIIE